MKKIFCGAVIAFIGTLYSITLIVMATINDVYVYSGETGLWGLLQGYEATLALILSLGVVVIGIAACIWGALEKKS